MVYDHLMFRKGLNVMDKSNWLPKQLRIIIFILYCNSVRCNWFIIMWYYSSYG